MVEVKYKMNIFLYLTVFYDVLSFTLSLFFRAAKIYKVLQIHYRGNSKRFLCGC